MIRHTTIQSPDRLWPVNEHVVLRQVIARELPLDASVNKAVQAAKEAVGPTKRWRRSMPKAEAQMRDALEQIVSQVGEEHAEAIIAEVLNRGG